jgi:hypothetical protein
MDSHHGRLILRSSGRPFSLTRSLNKKTPQAGRAGGVRFLSQAEKKVDPYSLPGASSGRVSASRESNRMINHRPRGHRIQPFEKDAMTLTLPANRFNSRTGSPLGNPMTGKHVERFTRHPYFNTPPDSRRLHSRRHLSLPR